jgi:hypothetical protein
VLLLQLSVCVVTAAVFVLLLQMSSCKLLTGQAMNLHGTFWGFRITTFALENTKFTYPEAVFVALGILHSTQKRRIVMCPAPSTIFHHYVTNGTIFGKMLLDKNGCLKHCKNFV